MSSCVVDHILQEFYTLFLTRFRTYKIATPSQAKITSNETFRDWCLLSSFVHEYIHKVCTYLRVYLSFNNRYFIRYESNRGRIKKTCMGPYAGVLSSTITSPVQCPLQHMYQGQTYARVALNPMPESTLSPIRDLGFGLSFAFFLYCALCFK